MQQENEGSESLQEFLDGLSQKLLTAEGCDAQLADILRLHILQAHPEQDAVAQAAESIRGLADQRADPPKVDTANG